MAKEEKKETYTLRFSPKHMETLKDLSERTGKSIKELIAEGLEECLKEQIEQLGEEIKRVEVEE